MIEINRNSKYTYRIDPNDPRIIESRQNVANARWGFCARYASADQARMALLEIERDRKEPDAPATKRPRVDWVMPDAPVEKCPRGKNCSGTIVAEAILHDGDGWLICWSCDTCDTRLARIIDWPFDDDEEVSGSDLTALGFTVTEEWY